MDVMVTRQIPIIKILMIKIESDISTIWVIIFPASGTMILEHHPVDASSSKSEDKP